MNSILDKLTTIPFSFCSGKQLMINGSALGTELEIYKQGQF